MTKNNVKLLVAGIWPRGSLGEADPQIFFAPSPNKI